MIVSMLNPHLPEPFFVMPLPKGVGTTFSLDFCCKASNSYDLGTGGGMSLLFPLIPKKKYQQPFIWRHNDNLMVSESRKTAFFRFFMKIGQISSGCISPTPPHKLAL